MTRRNRSRWLTPSLALGLVSALIWAPPVALAGTTILVNTVNQEINGDGFCSLQEAIYSANLDSNFLPDPHNPGSFMDTGCAEGSGDDTIYLQAGATYALSQVIEGPQHYLGPTGTPYVTSTIVIEAIGARIIHAAGSPAFRAFSVAEGGDLTLHEVHIQGFTAKGGDGAGGGGGGLGAGGAVYVHAGNLSIGWSTFQANEAIGGNGSSGNTGGAGGGGGGLGGRGGRPSTLQVSDSGGGGGGARGAGGDAFDSSVFATAPGGGGGTVTAGGQFGEGGFACGAEGGSSGTIGGANGDDADVDCRGGGGGGGDSESGITVPSGDGGHGSYGGGGGGGGYSQGDGGRGGFGGGGGAGPAFSLPDDEYFGGSGGHGGFGGGGGAGPGGVVFGDPGPGGTFAGDGTDLFGGAGAGLGGAIFGDDAIVRIENSTFSGNSVSHGLTNGPNVTRAQDAGGAIFTLGGTLTVVNSTISGNASTGDGAGLVVYKSSVDGETASVGIRNTIIAGNTGHDQCFLRNGPSDTGSTNNLITPQLGDVLPDCPGVTQMGDPGLGTLQLNEPGRTKTMAIGAGSPALDNADPVTSTADDQRGVPRPQGAGPDIGAFEFSGTPPLTTIALSPAAPDGSNGWYVGPVGVTISATDADSTVAQTRCVLDPATTPASFADLPDLACTLSSAIADGEHAIWAASVDPEGNAESPVVSATFKIDQTDPTLSPTLSSTTIVLNQSGVSASPNASDGTSGVASAGCGAVDTTTAGDHTVTCTASDHAGNTATATVHYVIEYQILGFFSPVPGSRWQAGSTVPIKIALGDAAGAPISDEEAQQLATDCMVTFSVTGAQAKQAQCLKYDPVNDQFVFTWKVAKRPLGDATITVTVEYDGTASTTALSEVINIVRL